jgi:hypothetical protein
MLFVVNLGIGIGRLVAKGVRGLLTTNPYRFVAVNTVNLLGAGFFKLRQKRNDARVISDMPAVKEYMETQKNDKPSSLISFKRQTMVKREKTEFGNRLVGLNMYDERRGRFSALQSDMTKFQAPEVENPIGSKRTNMDLEGTNSHPRLLSNINRRLLSQSLCVLASSVIAATSVAGFLVTKTPLLQQ